MKKSIRGSEIEPPTGSEIEPLRFSRVPVGVTRDRLLSSAAKIVYLEMALWVFDGTTCAIGQRAISERVGISRNTVARAIEELISRGHVDLIKPKPGMRSYYVLTADLFSAGVQEHPICDGCGRRLPKLKDACVACAREAAKRDAWIAAKAELPDGATRVEIAARVAANRVAKSYRAVARDAERLERIDAEWKAS